MKKSMIIILIILVTTIIGAIMISNVKKLDFVQNDVETIAMAYNKDFLVKSNDSVSKMFMKGVNVGATIPGHFPGELAISKETYLRWFEMIYDMNANVIRVYTTMMPCFYEALAEFNYDKEVPLYVLHGVWVDENKISSLQDAYANDGEIINEFIQDALDLVDIFHGNKTLPERAGFASGVYTADVSDYIIGWVLGIEWDPDFVIGTNEANSEKVRFSGNYLYTKNASVFEVFLAEVGDTVLQYEATNYHMTRPISYTNWLTTDLLSHSNEPDPKEDAVSVNTENIYPTEKAFARIFASYHVYPYYPEFMNYETTYQEWVDPETGETNPYKAYLNDLIDSHTVPVLVAEFGIPASRGVTHENFSNGYDQGGHNETEQGEMLVELLESIEGTDSMGALIFSWQDEWFKRTWNTMDFDLEWRRPFWSNYETNEQYFGLLAFDPGETSDDVHQVDGDLTDWEDITAISIQQNESISVDSDYRYLYLMIQSDTIDWNSDSVYIPIDTIENQGNDQWASEFVSFDQLADFVILIDGEDDSKIVVDQYYDATEYLYAEVLEMIEPSTLQRTKNSGVFSPIRHVLSAEITLPETNETIEFSMYDAGILHYGNSNPNSDDYDSLADFYFGEDFVEIRIPWLLLNVMDPSTKQVISDFNLNQDSAFVSTTSSGFQIGYTYQTSTGWTTISSQTYHWDTWQTVIYHERLKESYYLIQEAFSKIE